MRAPLICLSCLLSLLIASSSSGVTMAWTPIGNPDNACDTQPDTGGGAGCFGAVRYNYNIGTYDVTNAQYAEFLNAKAAVVDPFGLYNTNMGDPTPNKFGGITRSGIGVLHVHRDRGSRKHAGELCRLLRHAALRKLDE
jgi:sulfatase modifying factor 1